MIRNFFFLTLGVFGGLWFVWPQIFSTKGWECTKDVIASTSEEPTDFESLVEYLPNRIKLGLAVSPKTMLKREDLTRIEKFRIVGDACFR
tara:strand:- start:26 stop:295 length:270 start_codon:yes stop_codon:yes gene_type:complete